MNHFDTFALPHNFDLDVKDLSLRYRELQRAVHPDKFAAKGERERLIAVQKTAEVNDAYQTLKSPLLRAEYILSQQGVQLQGESKTINDPLFLMQQIELREALEELSSSVDPMAAASELEQQLRSERKSLLSTIETLLTEKKWNSAADSVRRLKFFYKLEQELSIQEEQWLN